MFRHWAKYVQLPWVRGILVLIGAVANLGLLPMLLLLAFFSMETLLFDPDDRFQSFGSFILCVGGFCALIAAWLRILGPSAWFQRNALFRWSVAGCLIIGLLVAAFLFFLDFMSGFSSPFTILYVFSILCGIFLLGATIGDKPVAQ